MAGDDLKNRMLNDLTCFVIGAGGRTGDLLVADLQKAGSRVIEVCPAVERSTAEVTPDHIRISGPFQLEKHVRDVIEELDGFIGDSAAVINIITEFDAAFDRIGANFSLALNWSKVLLPLLRSRSGSRIINIDRISAALAVEKTAVHSLTTTLNKEGAVDGIAARTVLFGEVSFTEKQEKGEIGAQSVADDIILLIGATEPPKEITIKLGSLESAVENDSETEENSPSETSEEKKSVKEKETEDLMSTLGLKSETDKSREEPTEEKQTSKQDELNAFNIDRDEADIAESGEPAALDDDDKEIAAEPQPADFHEPPAKQDGPADSSYLIDSDFSNFSVDEKVISNYRSSLADYKEGEKAHQGEGKQPGDPELPESEPVVVPEVPEKTETESPVEAGPKPTFYMVELYRRQGMPERALEALKMLENLEVDKERLERERREIQEELGRTVAEPIEEEQQAEPEQSGEDLIAEEATEGKHPEDEKPVPEGPDEDEYEQRRLAALKRRMGIADEEEPEPEVVEPPVDEDDLEQRRIEALKRRAGHSGEAAGEERPEDILKLRPQETKPEAVALDEEDHLPVYEPTVEEVPDDVEQVSESPLVEEESEERRSLPKWLWLSVAGVAAVVLIWLLWPSGFDEPVSEAPPPVVEAERTVTETAPLPAVADTVEEKVEVQQVTVAEPAVEKIPEKPTIVEQKQVRKTALAKAQPAVKTLPLRNLKVNQKALTLFETGNYWQAARIWAEEKRQNPEHFTIILIFGCEDKTIRNSYQQLGDPADFFLLPRLINGRECFTICWGDFKSLSDAKQWYGEIPKWFADNGAKPLIRSFRQIRMAETGAQQTTAAKATPPKSVAPAPAKQEVVKEPVPVETRVPAETEKQIAETVPLDTSVLDMRIAEAEQAFMSAMANLQKPPEPETDTMELAVIGITAKTPGETDSTVVVSSTLMTDDWIEMDTTTQALEPVESGTNQEFVEIADLDIDQLAKIPAAEPEPAEEPDYTPQQLLELERYSDAAGIWEIEKGASPGKYTVKLLVACQDISIGDAYNALNRSDEFFILPKKVDGENCFALCWGGFDSKKEAKKRLKEVPRWFERNGGKPAVATITEIME